MHKIMQRLPELIIPPTTVRGRPWLYVARIFLYITVSLLAVMVVMNLLPGVFSAVATGTAWLSYQLLRLWGIPTVVRGNEVLVEGFTCQIIFECTGIYSALILISAILASPASARRKAVGIAWGIPVVTVVNIARIAVLVIIGKDYSRYLEFFHGYLWQVTIILTVVIVYVLWLRRAVER